MSMWGTGSTSGVPAQDFIPPKTARSPGSGQIPNAIPLRAPMKEAGCLRIESFADAGGANALLLKTVAG
jgi:hypothetical protein